MGDRVKRGCVSGSGAFGRWAGWQLILFVLALVTCVQETRAQASMAVTTVTVGGVDAVLITPAKPIGSVILLAGGDGRIHVEPEGVIKRQGNQLVRTRMNYAQKGFAVLVPDYGYNLADLVTTMQKIKRPVTVVGTSRGTQRAARGIAQGARPDRLVLTSGFLSDASGNSENVISILEKPELLPPTLVVHHRFDRCKQTMPAGVADFMAWSKGRAKLVWLEGGEESGPPCEAQSHHGFLGLDQKVVDQVAQFAR
jgi:hypothetical protein